MKRFKKIPAILALAMGLAGCVVTSTKPTAESGTFTGEGSGKGGKIVVDVTLDQEEIKEIQVTESHESGVISDAYAIMREAMIAQNTPDVDMVSGATLTSAGFRTAVADAIKKSGVTLKEIRRRLSKKPMTSLLSAPAVRVWRRRLRRPKRAPRLPSSINCRCRPAIR